MSYMVTSDIVTLNILLDALEDEVSRIPQGASDQLNAIVANLRKTVDRYEEY